MTESPRNRAKCKLDAFNPCFIAKENDILRHPRAIYSLSLTSAAGHQRLAIAPRHDESPIAKSVRLYNHRRPLLWEDKLMSEFDAPLWKDDLISPYGT